METKLGKVKGSIMTVVPSALVNLMHLEKGDKLVWDADTEGVGVIVKVSKKEVEDTASK